MFRHEGLRGGSRPGAGRSRKKYKRTTCYTSEKNSTVCVSTPSRQQSSSKKNYMKNVFGGTNVKKQRSLFGDTLAQSVYRPLDVYNGKHC